MVTVTESEAWIAEIITAAGDYLAASGHFELTDNHEPVVQPTVGLTAGVWPQTIEAYQGGSGVNTTSMVLVLNIRMYRPIASGPGDYIEQDMLRAASGIIREWNGDFDLSGAVDHVDVLGMTGYKIRATAGYLEVESTTYRIMDIQLPCVVYNAWNQSA